MAKHKSERSFYFAANRLAWKPPRQKIGARPHTAVLPQAAFFAPNGPPALAGQALAAMVFDFQALTLTPNLNQKILPHAKTLRRNERQQPKN